MKVPALVVIGASAGGIEALVKLTQQLPEDLPAAVLIVVHVSSSVPSVLPEILARNCSLPVTHARHDEYMRSEQYFDVIATPLLDASGASLGVRIAFTDVTILHKLRGELQVSHREMETLNEELQSSNEELETTNEELRKRGQDLNRVNSFLESIMYGIHECLIVLDRNLQVRAWNRMAEDMWGLRLDEVTGQHFFNLDIGLPVDKLGTVIRSTLAEGSWDGAQEIVLPAVNRRGRAITVGVTATSLLEMDNLLQGVILVVKELDSGHTDAGGGG